MNRKEAAAIHAAALAARDAEYLAYKDALAAYRVNGTSSESAFVALVRANEVLHLAYQAKLDAIVSNY